MSLTDSEQETLNNVFAPLDKRRRPFVSRSKRGLHSERLYHAIIRNAETKGYACMEKDGYLLIATSGKAIWRSHAITFDPPLSR